MSETQVRPFYFDDHVVGDVVQCGSYEVLAEEVIDFASKWDPQPWHVDEEAAKASSLIRAWTRARASCAGSDSGSRAAALR